MLRPKHRVYLLRHLEGFRGKIRLWPIPAQRLRLGEWGPQYKTLVNTAITQGISTYLGISLVREELQTTSSTLAAFRMRNDVSPTRSIPLNVVLSVNYQITDGIIITTPWKELPRTCMQKAWPRTLWLCIRSWLAIGMLLDYQ